MLKRYAGRSLWTWSQPGLQSKDSKTVFRRGYLDSGQQTKSKVKTSTVLCLKATKEGSSYCLTHYKTPLYTFIKYDLIGNIRARSWFYINTI